MSHISIKCFCQNMCSRIYFIYADETCPRCKHILPFQLVLILYFLLLHTINYWLFILVFLIHEVSLQSHDSLVHAFFVSFFQFFENFCNFFVYLLLQKLNNLFVIISNIPLLSTFLLVGFSYFIFSLL